MMANFNDIRSALDGLSGVTALEFAAAIEKDELFLEGDPLFGNVFTVHALAFGYIRDFPLATHAVFGVGGLGTVDFLPAGLEPAYGKRNPMSFMLFVRAKLF